MQQVKTKENSLRDTSYPSERKEEKKRYKLRKVEEQEAEQQIEDFIENEDISDDSGTDRLNGVGPIGRECR